MNSYQKQQRLKKYIESGEFSSTQIVVIKKALECGLKADEIDKLADPKLTWYEMQAKLLEKSNLITM